jgi:hypothetical protein
MPIEDSKLAAKLSGDLGEGERLPHVGGAVATMA